MFLLPLVLPLMAGCADRWRDDGISIEQSRSLMSREVPRTLATAKPGDTATLAGKPLTQGLRETVESTAVASDTLRGLTVNSAPLPLVTKDTYQEPKLRLITMQGDHDYTPGNRGATRPELRWRGPLVLWAKTDDARPASPPPPKENFAPLTKQFGVPAALQDTIGLYFETREWFDSYGRVAVVAGPYGSGNLNPQPEYAPRNVAMFTVDASTSEIAYFARDGAITTDKAWWCAVYRIGTTFGVALSPQAAAKEVGPADLKPWPAGQGRFTPVRLDALNEERDVSLFWYPMYK